MHTLSSRPTKRLNRNDLLPHEQQLLDKEVNMIANELKVWLSNEDRLVIKFSKSPIQIPFYTELGRSIRNEYELWLDEHHITKIWIAANEQFPLPEDGPTSIDVGIGDGRIVRVSSNKPIVVDDHPCHPDNFSAECIKRLWEILQ